MKHIGTKIKFKFNYVYANQLTANQRAHCLLNHNHPRYNVCLKIIAFAQDVGISLKNNREEMTCEAIFGLNRQSSIIAIPTNCENSEKGKAKVHMPIKVFIIGVMQPQTSGWHLPVWEAMTCCRVNQVCACMAVP